MRENMPFLSTILSSQPLCCYNKAAQQRREDKIRAEKERIMQEDDPDRQRKLEVSAYA